MWPLLAVSHRSSWPKRVTLPCTPRRIVGYASKSNPVIPTSATPHAAGSKNLVRDRAICGIHTHDQNLSVEDHTLAMTEA